VGLQAHFLSDGEYVDPFEISAVTIYSRAGNLYPSSLLASSDNLLDPTLSSLILMNFHNYEANTSSVYYDASNFSEGSDGIFKTGVGKYIVVLDGRVNSDQIGLINLNDIDTEIQNSVSATGDYLDAWTIRMYENSDLQVVFNDFSLRKGGFTVVTEPLMVKAKSRLINSKITLGSKIDIKVATDIHVENTTIDSSVKNLMRETLISNASIEIQKYNDAATLPARVTVSSFADTSANVEVLGDNVMILNWDTNQLATHPELLAGNFGSIQGVYCIKAKFDILNQTIISDPMYLTLS
jgi:hypothetical protein